MHQQDNSTTTSGQGLSLVCTPELQGVGASEQRSSFYVMASITAPEFRAEKRAPVDMICVIDRSGSMSGDRIEMAKSTVEFVVANLQQDDRLGIVTYDDNVANHFPLRPMTADGKEAALSAIKAIRVGGSTNLCGGLVEGVNQMRSREAGSQTNQVASVLLFTDGQANAGYTQAEDIIKATINADHASGSSGSGGGYGGWGAPPRQQQQQRFTNAYMPQQQQQVPINFGVPQQQQQQQVPISYGVPQQQSPQPISYGIPQQQQLPVALQPVAQAQNPTDFGGEETEETEKKKVCEDLPLPCTINTFGFGADHDAALLKKIADHGQGIYYYIDSTKAIAEAFADCLGGLLSVVAQDIRVSFEAPAGGQAPVRINRVLTKFRSTEIEAGRAYELALGDIQSEERRDILVELSIANTSDVDAVLPVLKTTVTYTNVITGQQSASAETMATVRRPALPTGETRDYAVDRQLNRLLAAEAMEQANEAARDGEMERAREIIKRASGRIAESVSRDDEFCKSLVSDLERCEGGLQSQSSWATTGGKMLTNQMQAHYVQRSTNVGWAGQAGYQTSTRDRMQCNFKNS